MPKIRRQKLPDRLLIHLLTRVRQRSISHEQLTLLAGSVLIWNSFNPAFRLVGIENKQHSACLCQSHAHIAMKFSVIMFEGHFVSFI